jgi:hypothetical protein
VIRRRIPLVFVLALLAALGCVAGAWLAEPVHRWLWSIGAFASLVVASRSRPRKPGPRATTPGPASIAAPLFPANAPMPAPGALPATGAAGKAQLTAHATRWIVFASAVAFAVLGWAGALGASAGIGGGAFEFVAYCLPVFVVLFALASERGAGNGVVAQAAAAYALFGGTLVLLDASAPVPQRGWGTALVFLAMWAGLVPIGITVAVRRGRGGGSP